MSEYAHPLSTAANATLTARLGSTRDAGKKKTTLLGSPRLHQNLLVRLLYQKNLDVRVKKKINSVARPYLLIATLIWYTRKVVCGNIKTFIINSISEVEYKIFVCLQHRRLQDNQETC